MAQKKSKKAEDPGILQIEEELSIGNIEKIYKTILDALKKEDVQEINFKSSSQIDISGIQLIESIKKTFAQKGKEFRVHLNLPSSYIDLLINTGFSSYINLITQL